MQFTIQEQVFALDSISVWTESFNVKSSPRPYRVDFPVGASPQKSLIGEILKSESPLILVDSVIMDKYLSLEPEYQAIPTFVIEAREENKGIQTVIDVVEFLEKNKATKSSMLFVIGGGVVQDIGAFTAAMFKRGLPWTFVPTTLLAQGDSCVGGKTALNHKKTKNLLALFSSPRRVIIDMGFISTLSRIDFLSGAGEIFRLCITGGPAFLDIFESKLYAFQSGDHDAVRQLISTSLLVKRAVVEFDEFELDIRRSMNYGHSFGHALEALTNYAIPHGIGVTIGILVENELSHRRGILGTTERDRIISLGRKIIPAEIKKAFSMTSLEGILDFLRRDKKAEGAILKFASLESLGRMRFMDLPLNKNGELELKGAVSAIIKELERP